MNRRPSLAFADFDITNHKSSLLASCTVLYTIMCLLCGIVFPLADSFVTRKQENPIHTYYLDVFLIIQYMIGISILIYLQIYISKSDKQLKYADKRRDTNFTPVYDSAEEDATSNNIEDNAYNRKVTFNLPSEKENTSNISLPNLVPSVIIRDQRMRNFEFIDSTSEHESEHDSQPTKEILPIEKHPEFSQNDPIFSFDPILKPKKRQNRNEIKVGRDTEGVNLFLRLGAVGFGFGVMVHDGFKIADVLRLHNSTCFNGFYIPEQLLDLAFIFLQTFFVFKYHRVIFRSHKHIMRLILWQLTIIGLSQWFKTVIYEINHELFEDKSHHHVSSPHSHTNDSHDNHKNNLTCMDQFSFMVSPYLFPCAIEYNLICAAILYKMLQRIDNFSTSRHSHSDSYSSISTYENNIEHGRKKKISLLNILPDNSHSECHRSHKGFFIGLLVLMSSLVCLTIYLILKRDKKSQNKAIIVYQITQILLLIITSCAIVWTFFKISVLSFRSLTEEEALDDNLLLIGYFGVFTYNLFVLISAIASVSVKDLHYNYLKQVIIGLFITKSILEIIQSTLQVLFVIESSRKCCRLEIHVQSKPGRSHVTFLMITNLALWFISIFATKRADHHEIFINYYQSTPWNVITQSLLPLIIFFRFHASVCMSDIWLKCYKKCSHENE